MWTSKLSNSINLISLLKEFPILSINQHINTFNEAINTLFWCCLLFAVIFYNFNRLFQKLLKFQRIPIYKQSQTIRFTWNICFYSASIFFLFLYRKYFLLGRIERETEGLFPKHKNPLFLLTDNCSLFNSVSLFLITFYVTTMVMDITRRDCSDASSKLFYILLLTCLNSYGYENYLVTLNLILGVFHLLTDCLMLAALHTAETNQIVLRTFLFLRIGTWSLIFLNWLPFNYLIPTLYAKNFKLWLSVILWVWYGSCIWNSPVLCLFYHKIYHQTSDECTGGNSAARCLLLKDFPERRHFKNLQQAVIDIRSSNVKARRLPKPPSDNPSVAALQTIKCIMTLKRKLRRIRENKNENL